MLDRAIALCALPIYGCSFMFSNGPPEGHENLRYFDCSSNYAAPATDGLLGGTYAAGAVVFAVDEDAAEKDRGAAIATAGSLGAVFLTSMVYGLLKNSACADAKQSLQQRLRVSDSARDR